MELRAGRQVLNFGRSVWDFCLYYHVYSKMQRFTVYLFGYHRLFSRKTVSTETRMEIHSVYIHCYKVFAHTNLHGVLRTHTGH
jgi:hypothetical protein